MFTSKKLKHFITPLICKVTHYPVLIVVGIILINFLLLSADVTNFRLDGDNGRDMLIGRLLLEAEQPDFVYGHWNSGIQYFYPSWYYWIVSFGYFLSGSIDAFLVWCFVVQMVCVVFLYGTVKNVFDTKTAVVATGLWAFSYTFTTILYNTISAHLALIPYMIGWYLVSVYYQTKKLIYGVLGCACVVLAASFFHGIILSFPLVMIVLAITARKKRKWELVLMLGLLPVLYGLLYLQMMWVDPGGFFSSVVLGNGEFLNVGIELSQIWNVLREEHQILFSGSSFWLLVTVGFGVIFSVVSSFLQKVDRLKFSLLLGSVILGYSLALIKGNNYSFQYLLVIRQLVFVLFAVVFWGMLRKTTKIGKILAAVFLVCVVFSTSYVFFPRYGSSDYGYYSKLAKVAETHLEQGRAVYYYTEPRHVGYFNFETNLVWAFLVDVHTDSFKLIPEVHGRSQTVVTAFQDSYLDDPRYLCAEEATGYEYCRHNIQLQHPDREVCAESIFEANGRRIKVLKLTDQVEATELGECDQNTNKVLKFYEKRN